MADLAPLSLNNLAGKIDYNTTDTIKLLFQLSLDEDENGEISENEAKNAKAWYDRDGKGFLDKEGQAKFIAGFLLYNSLHRLNSDPNAKYFEYNKTRIAQAVQQIRDDGKINIRDYLGPVHIGQVECFFDELDRLDTKTRQELLYAFK